MSKLGSFGVVRGSDIHRPKTIDAYSPFPPHSFLNSPHFPLPSLCSPPLPLEVGPLNLARGSGERCKLAQRPGQSPAAKRYLMHFWLKNASDESNFKDAFTKTYLSLVCLHATSLGEVQIGQRMLLLYVGLFVGLLNYLGVIVCLSVRPSVRLSVISRSSTKIENSAIENSAIR